MPQTECGIAQHCTHNQRIGMKSLLNMLLCFAMLPTTALFALDGTKIAFNAKTNKHPLKYEIDEPMVFTFTLDLKGQNLDAPLTIEWTRTGDDGATEEGAVVYDGKAPATMTTKLGCNGFVRIYAKLKQADGKYLKSNAWRDWFFDGGAAVHPESLTSTPEPTDFDEFWARQKARLDKVPIIADLKELNRSDVAMVYAARILCAGPRPATGILTIPLGAEEGRKYPILITLHGYGPPKYNPNKIVGRGASDKITFSLNSHGVEYQRDEKYYIAFNAMIKENGEKYAFNKEVNEDPEITYFNGMALRLMRALQYLKTLEAWNGKDLHAQGGSQGGLQAIWAAALDSDVSLVTAEIPWCCDIGGYDNYKCMNMAKRVHCPVEITRAGLGDYACPPSGVAIMYNNLKCKKSIVWHQGSEHSYIPENCETFRLEAEAFQENIPQ